MTPSLVSVIVPTYNRAYCLARALDSILCQTYEALEVVVIDDGSTDNTRELVSSRYAHDARVRYFYEENRGVTAARNQGIKLSRGDYVAFLDSDDTWERWKLELQVACLRHCPEIGMVWTDMDAVGPDGTVVSKNYLRKMYGAYRWFTTEQLFSRSHPLTQVAPHLAAAVGNAALYTGDIFSQMVMGNLVHTSTVVLRRDRLAKVHGFNEALRLSGEDYDLYLRTCREGPVGFINLATIRYQTGMPDQLTRPEYKLYAARNCLQSILPVMANDRARIRLPRRMLSTRLAEVHSWVGYLALERGELSEARRHLLASLWHRPLQPRHACLLAITALPFGIGLSIKKLYRSFKSRIRSAGVPVPGGASAGG
jgi:glycosyltransferase involved in cell wall biosynthesis